MKSRGEIKQMNGNTVVIALESAFGLEDLSDVDVTIVKHRNKRSIDANNYYYLLAGKIAQNVNLSLAEYHNRTLAELGIAWLDENGDRTLVLMRDDNRWMHTIPGENHFAPTSKTMTDKHGDVWRWFYLLKPTRQMDTKEMSSLIDYVVQDAKNLGIETLADREIERIINEW